MSYQKHYNNSIETPEAFWGEQANNIKWYKKPTTILSKDEKISLTEKMSGTTFKAQKILAESIMTESPELIETIIANPEIRKAAEEFWKDIGRLLTAVQEGKTEEVVNYVKTCQERLAENTDLESSYKKLTTMVNAIDKK